MPQLFFSVQSLPTTFATSLSLAFSVLVRRVQCEGWINEASQFLLTIGRKATECKQSQDAVGLISQLNHFKEDGATKQNDRLNNMERIATNLYGN